MSVFSVNYKVETMVSDQELAKGVETLLRQSDPNAFTSLNGVVQQLEANLGLNLSHKAGFIRDHISFLLRAHPQPQPQPQPQSDHFALLNHSQFPTSSYPQQFSPHFNLNFQHCHPADNQPFPSPPSAQAQPRQLHPQPRPQPANTVSFSQNASILTSAIPKESTPVGGKRRGGPGGLNKVCGVSPELQAIVGEPALPRTEIVKQLWAYIRKNNLQDPSNKRKIICDDALRVVFETDCTDMFKMNKLLAKHITALEPTKETQAKRVKTDVDPSTERTESVPSPVVISDALAKFLGAGEREMLQSEAVRRVWEYIKANQLEDPKNSMVILCDKNLRDLFGFESISAVDVSEMLARHHLFKC